MTGISVSDGTLHLEVEGCDRLWALRSDLTISIAHVVRAYANPEIAEGWWKGLRVGGTNVPGVVAAGTFYQHGNWIFWDVHNPAQTIVIELHDERYAKLIVEVADPAAAVSLIENSLAEYRP